LTLLVMRVSQIDESLFVSFEALHVCTFLPCYLSAKNNSLAEMTELILRTNNKIYCCEHVT